MAVQTAETKPNDEILSNFTYADQEMRIIRRDYKLAPYYIGEYILEIKQEDGSWSGKVGRKASSKNMNATKLKMIKTRLINTYYSYH